MKPEMLHRDMSILYMHITLRLQSLIYRAVCTDVMTKWTSISFLQHVYELRWILNKAEARYGISLVVSWLAYRSVSQSVCLLIHPSTCLSKYLPPIHPSSCLSNSLSVSIYMSLCVSIYIYPCPDSSIHPPKIIIGIFFGAKILLYFLYRRAV
jgi:hypothetical protein